MNLSIFETNQAIATAGSNANIDWMGEAIATVSLLIRIGEDFTTDSVLDLLDQKEVRTHETRALGAVMRKFAVTGDIRAVGYRKSDRASCHNRPKAIWRPTPRALRV